MTIINRLATDPLPLDFGSDKPFYVYMYRDPRPMKRHAPIYVGKGRVANARADIHWRRGVRKNPLLRHILAKLKRLGLDPLIEIVGWFDLEEDALALERMLISRIGRRDIKSGPLANLTGGGDGGSALSPDIKAAISRKLKGRPVPPERRDKISRAQIGRVFSEETKAAMRAAWTPERRAAYAASRIGIPLSAAHRAAVSRGKMGIKASEQARENISAAHLAKRKHKQND